MRFPEDRFASWAAGSGLRLQSPMRPTPAWASWVPEAGHRGGLARWAAGHWRGRDVAVGHYLYMIRLSWWAGLDGDRYRAAGLSVAMARLRGHHPWIVVQRRDLDLANRIEGRAEFPLGDPPFDARYQVCTTDPRVAAASLGLTVQTILATEVPARTIHGRDLQLRVPTAPAAYPGPAVLDRACQLAAALDQSEGH